MMDNSREWRIILDQTLIQSRVGFPKESGSVEED
ncbi:MAG: hypothetical protein ACJAZW_002203 [Maritalea sp.]|jgi:hypothetical protein